MKKSPRPQKSKAERIDKAFGKAFKDSSFNAARPKPFARGTK